MAGGLRALRGAGMSVVVLALTASGAVALDYEIEVGDPVKPTVVDVDLSQVQGVEAWQPGDPIKEIPKRRYPTPGQPEFTPAAPKLDPLLEAQRAATGRTQRAFGSTLVDIAGLGYTGVNPPDTVGDVGPDYYIQSINGSGGALFKIFDKSGAAVTGTIAMDSLGSGNCASGLGDPIVLYDELAGRWVLSEFSSGGNRMCVYVSQSGDPVAGGWYNYDFAAPSFPDYPKYGVWPSAYFVGTNEGSDALYAFDRQQMLNGGAASLIRLSVTKPTGFGFHMMIPADHDGLGAPPNGAPGLFMRHCDDEVHNNCGSNDPQSDVLQIYEFTPNFASPGSSTLAGPIDVQIAEIDSDLCGLTSFSCFPQPSTSVRLDPLREVVMWRLQYRNDVGSHQTLVGNLVTDVTGGDVGGVRWFELRNSGGGWTLAQEGTYSPDGTNRWMASAAMDVSGNIAVAYSVSSSSVRPGMRYAGRTAGAAPGTLPEGEHTIIAGSGSNGSNRWGDYSALSVDPSDGCTFWHTNEYSPSSQWGTRIAAFRFDDCGGGGVCTDGDGDGYGDPGDFACSGGPQTDCDDSNPAVNPGATEVCGNGLDDDCDGAIDAADPECIPCIDGDGDGYGDPASPNCSFPQLDCDDGDPSVNPGASEIPGNGVDDDCNPSTPSGCQQERAEASVSEPGARLQLPLDLAWLALPIALALAGLRRRRARV